MPKHAKEKEPSGSLQTAVRLENEVIIRLDALIKKMSRPGLRLSRTDIIRMALAEGLPILEKESR
jgi:predicted DNA-binding protein